MQRGPATLRGSRGQQSSCARPAPLHDELPCVPTMHAFLLVAERAVVCSSTHTMTRCLPGAMASPKIAIPRQRKGVNPDRADLNLGCYLPNHFVLVVPIALIY